MKHTVKETHVSANHSEPFPSTMCGKKWVLLLVFMLKISLKHVEGGGGEPQVPCYFIFGDSLADCGNNNYLLTLAKVNYTPYGIDFPYGPTGRFCNGRTTVDIIAEYLGFEQYIPPFATANGTEILFGVNYASGSAGILDETAEQLGQRIPMNMQLRNHETTISRLVEMLGDEYSASTHLRKCLYSVGMGNNDYINNYFLPQYYNTSKEYTLDQFAQFLIQKYTDQLLTLYEYGARKIVLFGLGLIGCTPNAIETYGTNGSTCVNIMNTATQIFNSRLALLVDQFNSDLRDATFIYINSSALGYESSVLDFEYTSSPCCEVSGGLCVQDSSPCKNRTEYAFWDGFHPTETLNIFTASRSYIASGSTDVYPFDIHHLVMLDQEAVADQ